MCNRTVYVTWWAWKGRGCRREWIGILSVLIIYLPIQHKSVLQQNYILFFAYDMWYSQSNIDSQKIRSTTSEKYCSGYHCSTQIRSSPMYIKLGSWIFRKMRDEFFSGNEFGLSHKIIAWSKNIENSLSFSLWDQIIKELINIPFELL